jgi:hypothetical protein
VAKWRTERPLENPAEIRRRLAPAQLFAPHVAPLNRVVERLRELPEDGSTVPWFDPAGAGVDARVLVLGRDPSRVAHATTGFISPDNPDPTADNMSWLRDEAGLRPTELIHWNVVPWFIGDRDEKGEARRSRPWLEKVLAFLPRLEAVACFGELAADSWNAAEPRNRCRDGWRPGACDGPPPAVVWCAHTTNRNIVGANRTRSIKDGLNPEERIRETLSAVAQRLR